MCNCLSTEILPKWSTKSNRLPMPTLVNSEPSSFRRITEICIHVLIGKYAEEFTSNLDQTPRAVECQ